MLIAGETSGDLLAAELVGALREKMLASSLDSTADVQPLRTALAPRFFGAGGPHMKAAGVELAFDLTQHSVIGIAEVFKKYSQFRRIFKQLLKLAIERQPDVIIGVDYGGFNLRFGKAIKNYVRKHRKEFVPWNPKLVQFVSPQVWASRPGRARTLAENHDLLLSIFPFEKEWYGKRVPKLRVEFVGHPMIGRYTPEERVTRVPNSEPMGTRVTRPSEILLLPGSREDEVRRHWPVVTGAFELLRRELPTLRGKIVLPNDALAQSARSFSVPTGLEIQVGGLASALTEADLAITKSGTITMECAIFGVPALVFYRTSWPTYFIAKQIVRVRHLAMPNLLAVEELFPEFIQHAATPEKIARAALDLLNDPTRRETVKAKLAKIVASLGGRDATTRAADAVARLLP
ncbi:MAG: lipid-A-disaccharide synthase [Verrucomicrobia bacterium]|jgi:lipid-A-disaccharide synthase|nr:lipid-A-disaccharide synthase [Verrucomicrobiota bacterium]